MLQLPHVSLKTGLVRLFQQVDRPKAIINKILLLCEKKVKEGQFEHVGEKKKKFPMKQRKAPKFQLLASGQTLQLLHQLLHKPTFHNPVGDNFCWLRHEYREKKIKIVQIIIRENELFNVIYGCKRTPLNAQM